MLDYDKEYYLNTLMSMVNTLCSALTRDFSELSHTLTARTYAYTDMHTHIHVHTGKSQ